MVVGIEALDAVAIGRAEVLKAATLKRMVDAIAPVVRTIVPVPVVVGDMGHAVDAATVVTFGFRLGAPVVPLRRRWRDTALVGTRGMGVAVLALLAATLPASLFGALRESRDGNKNCQCGRCQ
jgi:hypothetical protein